MDNLIKTHKLIDHLHLAFSCAGFPALTITVDPHHENIIRSTLFTIKVVDGYLVNINMNDHNGDPRVSLQSSMKDVITIVKNHYKNRLRELAVAQEHSDRYAAEAKDCLL